MLHVGCLDELEEVAVRVELLGSHLHGVYLHGSLALGCFSPRGDIDVLVVVNEPRNAIWGGVVAAPAFSQIASYDLQYLEVPPDAAGAFCTPL